MTVDKPDDPAEEGTLTSDGRSIPTNTFTRIFHADSNASQEGLFRRRNESLHKSLTNYGVFSLQGKRPTMEDAHKAMPRVLLSEIHKDKEIDMKKFQTSVVLDADCDSSHATDNKDTNSKDAPPSSDDTGPDKTRTITSAIDTQTHALGSDTDNDDDIKAQVSSSSSSSSSASSQAHAHAHDLYGFFSVMDGHGGDQCALFVSQTLPSQLFTHAKYKTDVEEALLDSFHSTEALWTDKATKQSLDGGSTALCALFIGSIMYVVNLGDSEAVLCRKNTGISLLKPHNPKKNPEEAKRVVEAGGRLYRNRLGHPVYNPQYFNIAVSRAFGDMMFKDEGFCKGKKSGLICTPELRKIELYNEDQFLILACDGLWDVLSPQKAVDFVLANVQHYRKSVINKMKQMKQMRRSKMMEKEKAETGDEKNIHDNKNELDDGDNDDNDGGYTKAPACGAVDDTGFDEKNIKIEVDWNQIARNLVNYAYKKGSTDNITALIVSFTDVNNY